MKRILLPTILWVCSHASAVLSQSVGAEAGDRYQIGTPILTDLWVDPVRGQDARPGATRAEALRTLREAWNRIPARAPLTATGYRIKLVAGRYPAQALPDNGWMDSRQGTYRCPIIIQAADGRNTATLEGWLNFCNCAYVYLVDFNVVPRPAGDALHAERCDHLLMRGMVLNGGGRADQTVKVNQCQYVYLEDCEVCGASDTAVDFVAVRYGQIVGNRIHDAADWCLYLKGGSAYFRVEGNELYNGATGGFSAGQGTGFEFMVSPWLHYEAYDIKFVNNVVHDTQGAGMGVNGGYNILLAYNTLYRVGRQSHLIEVVFGQRGCDGDRARAAQNLAAGGWGTTAADPKQPIPDRNVFIYNNLVYNPRGYESQWKHFAIYGAQTPTRGSNIPSPAQTDTNLQIRGNIIWNGPPTHPLGIEEADQGCQPSNPTCNAARLRAENAINTIEPQLVNPSRGDFHPVSGGNVFRAAALAIPDFTWADAPSRPAVPGGTLINRVPNIRDGTSRAWPGHPGAY
jgi:hypothetical protein